MPNIHSRNDNTIWLAALAITAVLLGAATLVAAPISSSATAQEPLVIGIDADPSGNEPTSLASIEPCVSVSSGDVFDIDIFVRDVDELLAWEIYVEYDPALLEVVGRDVELFMAANPDSAVLDVSAKVPEREGRYRAAAADTSDPPTPDSGSGVLFRLSLMAHSPGTSKLELAIRDINGDGTLDIGPLLRDVDANILGDVDGDTIFDGPIENAEVAVDTTCSGLSPSPTSSPNSSGISPVLIAIAAAGGAAALLVAGLVAFRLKRSRRAAP